MNRELIENAILSAINLLSDELDSIISDDLLEKFELTLAELYQALKELKKE